MIRFYFWGHKEYFDSDDLVNDTIKNLTTNKYKGYFLIENENDRFILNALCRINSIPNKFYYYPAKYYYENMLDKKGNELGWIPEGYKEA